MRAPRKLKPRNPLRSDVAAAIEHAWPDGEVGMLFDSEESWFWAVHPTLAHSFRRLTGARLLHERAAELDHVWTDPDDDDEDDVQWDEPTRSYHLFFVSPADDAFVFESEIESTEDPVYDEFENEDEFVDWGTVTVPCREHAGWVVAVSLVAPFAVIVFGEYSIYDDGTTSEPPIEPWVMDDNGNRVDLEADFRENHGERLFQKLDKLRTRIAGILEKEGVTVLPEAEWSKPAPGLRGDGEVLIGDVVGRPIRVLDAFFFQSIV